MTSATEKEWDSQNFRFSNSKICKNRDISYLFFSQAVKKMYDGVKELIRMESEL